METVLQGRLSWLKSIDCRVVGSGVDTVQAEQPRSLHVDWDGNAGGKVVNHLAAVHAETIQGTANELHDTGDGLTDEHFPVEESQTWNYSIQRQASYREWRYSE